MVNLVDYLTFTTYLNSAGERTRVLGLAREFGLQDVPADCWVVETASRLRHLASGKYIRARRERERKGRK